MRKYWIQEDMQVVGHVMLWAAATLCFHGFVRAERSPFRQFGVLLQQYTLHGVMWRQIAISPSIIKVHLKQSKTDQLGRGVDVL